MKIFVTLPDGTVRETDGEPGQSLMLLMLNAGVPVVAACGGAMACATCHVQVAEDWFDRVGAPGPEESELLNMSEYRGPTSRLSCQVRLNANLNGLQVALQPDAADE